MTHCFQFLSSYSLLLTTHQASAPNHCTKTALLKITNDLCIVTFKCQVFRLFLVNLSAASDKINHWFLLETLTLSGTPPSPALFSSLTECTVLISLPILPLYPSSELSTKALHIQILLLAQLLKQIPNLFASYHVHRWYPGLNHNPLLPDYQNSFPNWSPHFYTSVCSQHSS